MVGCGLSAYLLVLVCGRVYRGILCGDESNLAGHVCDIGVPCVVQN